MSGQVVLLVRLLRAGLVQQLACCHCAWGRAPAAQVLNKHHAGRPILYLGGLAAAAGLLGSCGRVWPGLAGLPGWARFALRRRRSAYCAGLAGFALVSAPGLRV